MIGFLSFSAPYIFYHNLTSTMACNQFGGGVVIDLDQVQPDSFMMSYIPLHICSHHDSQTLVFAKSRGIFNEERKKLFYSRIWKWLDDNLSKIDSSFVMIAIAPGHEANLNPSGFMHDIVSQIINPKFAGTIPLYRVMTVSKSTETPGPRSKAKHEGTISLYPPTISPTSPLTVLPSTNFYQDKVIIILDDVWTSGSTLCACKDVVKALSPKAILLFAIGKTTYPPLPYPHSLYFK